MDCGRGSEQLQLRELGACRHTHTHTHTHTYIHALLFLFVVSSHLVFLASTVFISLFAPFYPLDCKEEIGGVGKRKRRGLKHGRPFFFFLSFPFSFPAISRPLGSVRRKASQQAGIRRRRRHIAFYHGRIRVRWLAMLSPFFVFQFFVRFSPNVCCSFSVLCLRPTSVSRRCTGSSF